MSTRGSWVSYKLQSFVELLVHRYRSCSSYSSLNNNLPRVVSVPKLRHGYSMHQGLQLMINTNNETWRKLDSNVRSAAPSPAPAPPPPPPKFNFSLWMRWILGSILTVVLPFWKLKWEKFKRIEGETEMVLEEVESVAEVVEKVATMAEKVSKEVAEKLPDHGKLQEAALFLERVSKAAAHDAEITVNLIKKVDALKEDINELETMVDPIVDKIIQYESHGK